MELQREMERCMAAMLMNDLSFYKDSPRDIGYQSLIYLNLIRYTDRCTVGRLSELLDLDKSTVSRKVESLVREGLVTRDRDDMDGRVAVLELSPDMERLYDRYDEPYEHAIERIRSELGPDGTRTVCLALRILTEEISK